VAWKAVEVAMGQGGSRRRYVQIGSALIAAAVILGITTVYVGTRKQPNALAAGLLQAITLVFSTVGAYYFATASARVAAEEMVRPHARSAFRRLQNLYGGLGRLLIEVNTQIAFQDDDKARLGLQTLRSMVIEQASTADDALEDWRDLVPDEVQRIEIEVKARTEGQAGS
jgi:hypothetical protein